jgi:putative RNA 2'-phosphotransferase
LKKQSRQFVHLSEYEEQAVAVGRRHGKLVLLMVNAGEMYEKGFIFYKSVSGVWLTDHVPAEYLVREE